MEDYYEPIWSDMEDPLRPTREEQQRERYLPPWAQDLIKELRFMVNEATVQR